MPATNRQSCIGKNIRIITALVGVVVLTAFLVAVLLPAGLQAQAEKSVPAVFLRKLDPPGTNNGLLRPQQVFIDQRFNEVFIVDTGNNRVAVFDTSGIFKFQFSGRDEFGSPTDLVVDSHGFIYVVGTQRQRAGSVFKFDYDGTLMGRLELIDFADSDTFDVRHIAIDSQDILYLMSGAFDRIVKIDAEGKYQGEFPLVTDMTEKERQEVVMGSPRIDGELLYLPVSMFGVVYVYDLSGTLVRRIGLRGNNIGELNFPTAVDVIDHALVLVLDKHRFNVVCFTTAGQFLGEFGGMGNTLGWFYHPERMAVDNLGRIYVSQIFLNRVQVCELPEFIAEQVKSFAKPTSSATLKPWKREAQKEEVSLEFTTPLLNSRSFVSD